MNTTNDLKISHLVTEIFRNGTADNINTNFEIVGFILGAIDNGFSVKLSGFMPIAKRGKVEIILRFNRDDNGLNMVVFKGKEKQAEFGYKINDNGFLWMNVDNENRSSFTHNKIFICSYN